MAFQSSLPSILLISSLLGDSFHVTELLRLSVYFVRCLPLLLVTEIFPLYSCFSSPPALFICPKNCSCLFLMILSSYLLCPAFSITSSFDFYSFHDVLLWYSSDVPHFCCFKSSFQVSYQCPAFTSMQRNGSYVGFHSVDFSENFDISVGENGLHLGECVFRESYSFVYFCIASDIWGYCKAHVFKGAYLFYSFPFAKNFTYRNVWLFWDDQALSLLCMPFRLCLL